MMISEKKEQMYQIPITVTSKHKSRFIEKKEENIYEPHIKHKGHSKKTGKQS